MKPIERRDDYYQSVELPDRVIEACGVGSRPMSDMDRRWQLVTDHAEIEGCRFLDVGCAEGAFMVRAVQAGARRVAAVERDDARRERAYENLAAWGWGRDRVDIQHEFSPWLPAADVVICFSVLHYVRHVFWFIDRLCEATAATLLFEFPVQPADRDACVEYRGPEHEGLILPWWLLRDRMARFGKVEVLADPDISTVGRRVIGCLTRER